MKTRTTLIFMAGIIGLIVTVGSSIAISNLTQQVTPTAISTEEWGLFPEGAATLYTTAAAFQSFERGFMVWRQDKNCVYAIQGDQAVLPVSRYGYCLSVAPLTDQKAKDTPPSGLNQPDGVLGQVWRYYPQVQAQLGFALQAEQSYTATIPTDPGPTIGMDGSPYYRNQMTMPDGQVLACGSRSATQGSCELS